MADENDGEEMEDKSKFKFAPTKAEIDAMKHVCAEQAQAAPTRAKARIWKRLYLIIDLLSQTGIRLSELVGQRPKVAFCRCQQCRTWRLHKQGLKTEEIVAELQLKGVGSRKVEDLIELANAEGEHSRQPLPGIRVKDINFDHSVIRIYGKGWASGRHGVEEQPVASTELMERIKKYIISMQLKPNDRLMPLSARRVEQLIEKVARLAGVEHADLMSPHKFRSAYITDIAGNPNLPGAEALVAAQRAARHVRIDTTASYVDIRKEALRKAIRDGLARHKESAAK
jgi:integrase